MGCGCKKNKKDKKTSTSRVSSKEQNALIRQKILEQIQKGNTNPKPPQ